MQLRKILSGILFITLMIPSLAMANIPWTDIVTETTYTFEKTFKIKNTNISFRKGSVVNVTERAPLNMIQVEMFKMEVKNCQYPEVTSGLELYPIRQPNGTTTTIGIEVSKGCKLEMFVELKDLNTNSFFY